MAFLDLPTELILLILPTLFEPDLAHLLQVHRSLYGIVLPYLYRRHLQDNKNNSTKESKNEANGFFLCVATGNKAGVQRFLTHGADVNAVTSAVSMRHAGFHAMGFVPWHDMQTPLNVAANRGDDELVSLLLSHGAGVNGSFDNHIGGGGGRRTAVQPAVVDALLSNHPSTVRLLLQHKSPLSGPYMERGGLLNCAIARENLSLLEMLVCEFGADLNGSWQEGVYPLNRAVGLLGPKAVEVVKFMLDHGADVALANGDDDTGGGGGDGGGQRLLNQAIRHGTIDTLNLLLTRGIVSPSSHPLDNDIFRTWIVERCTPETVHLLHSHAYFRALDDTQDDVLMIAVRARRGDILQLFIDSGVADLNARRTRGGSTLLHTAVVRCRPLREGGGPPPIRYANITSRAFSDPLVRRIEPDIDPLHVSSRRCTTENEEKCTPEEIVRCLVRGGADVHAKDERGISPLDLAEKGPEVVYKMLVDSSSPV